MIAVPNMAIVSTIIIPMTTTVAMIAMNRGGAITPAMTVASYTPCALVSAAVNIPLIA